jgi:hypothetical protein
MHGSSLAIKEGEEIVQIAVIEAQIRQEITSGEGS